MIAHVITTVEKSENRFDEYFNYHSIFSLQIKQRGHFKNAKLNTKRNHEKASQKNFNGVAF